MERPIFQPVGTLATELDTPALVLDLDKASANIERFHKFFADTDAKIRPHISPHQCPKLARLQLEAGGTVGGIAVTTVGEAEVFNNAGFDNILVTSQVVPRPTIRRLCGLARQARITVVVDDAGVVNLLSEAAVAAGVKFRTLVELEAGAGKSGVAPGEPALSLVRDVERAPGLEFFGLMAEEGPIRSSHWEEVASETHRRLQPVVDTRELIEKNGIPVSQVSVGSTYNYDTAGRMTGITEVQAGLYPLMDQQSLAVRREFSPAARILSAVISHPVGQRAVVDAGHKATAPDEGLPLVDGIPGATAVRFSAEHGILELDEGLQDRVLPGDKVWLLPYDLQLTANQYDYFRVIQQGRLVGYWPISARGSFS